MRMTIEVVATGKTTATAILTQEQVDAVRGAPGRARVPLAVTYGGSVFRTSISIYRGRWMMVVNQAMREGGLAPGGTYPVDLSVDTVERTVDLPADLAAALESAQQMAAWNALSYTNRKEFVRGIEEAKKPETRAKRLAKVIESLVG